MSATSCRHEGLVLYGHWICPYSVRVEFALGQLGIAHELVEVPPSGVRPAGFVLPDAFIEGSPRREIPMIVDAAGSLVESLDILEHLDPATPEVHEAAAAMDALAFPPMIGVYYGRDREVVAEASASLEAALRSIAERLEGTGWLVGDGPSMAEAALVPLYLRLGCLAELGFDGDVPASVVDHIARLEQTPGWAAAAWDDAQRDLFVATVERARGR